MKQKEYFCWFSLWLIYFFLYFLLFFCARENDWLRPSVGSSWLFASHMATLSFHQSVSSTAKTNDVNYYHHFFSQKKTVFTKRYTEKRTRTQSFPYERKSEAKKRQRMRWSQFAISWDLALTNSLTIASSISLIFSNYMLKLGAS